MAEWLDGVLQGGDNVGLTSATETQIDDTDAAVERVEGHLDHAERWLGNTGSATTLTPYTVISGNSAFGDYVTIVGESQTPVVAGNTHFDMGRVYVQEASVQTLYRVRVLWGTSGASATANNRYTEFPVQSALIANKELTSAIEIPMPQLASGTTVWAQCKNATNVSTLKMLFGIHERTVT